MNNLYVVVIGYLMLFVIFLVFLVFYILSVNFYFVRFKLCKYFRFQFFWFMILFVYNYLVVIIFMLLYCFKVGGKFVFFYDGNVECFKGEYLVMFFLVVFVLVGLVIFLFVVVFVLIKGFWRVDLQYVNMLINGLCLYCWWWWLVDMLRRVVLMVIYLFIFYWFIKQVSKFIKILYL